MRIKTLLLTIIIVIGIFSSLFSSVAAATYYDTVYVDDTGLGGNHFDTIAGALDNVNNGGTVYISAGSYPQSGSLTITYGKTVTIIGAGSDDVIIDGQGGIFPIFFIDGGNLYISGCTIRGGTYGFTAYLGTGNVLEIRDCEITGNLHSGINALMGQLPALPESDGDDYIDTIIEGNHIHHNDGAGIDVVSEGTCYLEIFENEVNDNGDEGIGVTANEGCLDCYIYDNEIYKNGMHTSNTGIDVLDSPENMLFLDVYNNYIHEENGDGICVIASMDGYDSFFGIYLEDTIWVYENRILDCIENGIYLGFHIDLYYIPLMDVQIDGADGYDYFESDISIFDNEIGGNGDRGVVSYLEVDMYEAPDVEGGIAEYIYTTFCIAENEIYDNALYGIDLYAEVTDMVDDAVDGDMQYYFISKFAGIYRNEVYGNYGGISLYDIPALVINNLVAGNYKEVDLDGLQPSVGILIGECDNILLVNNTIVENVGGIEYIRSTPYIINNIVASNQTYGINDVETPGQDGNFYYEIENNDVWGNLNNYVGMADLTGSYGNISEDPRFYGMYDARLLSSSPCIDAGQGEEMLLFAPEDIDGTPRPQGSGIDMGCYEMPVNDWSPRWITPLAALSISKANVMWGCIMENLPENLNPEVIALMDEIQALIGQATSLANPVLTNGLMQQALELMAELSGILGCECGS